MDKAVKDEITKISGNVADMVKCPMKTAGFEQLLIDTKEIK